MKLYNNFTGAAMNKDLELRVFPKSLYLDAKNIRIVTPDGQNSRSVKFAMGNTQVTALSLGNNAECIGECVDTFRNKIYWAVVSDSGSYINEYDVATATENIVLSDTRGGASNLFGFVTGGYVEMRVLNDNDNGKNFIVITDGENEPKFFEIEAGKALTDSSFIFEDISLIKKPPYSAPSLTLGNTVSDEENNLEIKFLSFAYRYKYQNGEYTALSPFSEFAFEPDFFSYNYNSGINKSMFNAFSKVDITLVAGTANVTDVQLIVKESGSNTAYIVDTYNKAKEGWSNGASEIVTFDNSRIYKALENNQLTRIYDNIPTKAATLELIGNRIVFGNYTEGYNLTYNGADADLDLSLGYTTAAGTEGVAHQQVKTNRDYEVAIGYGDGKGRFTTPIVTPNNTTFIPFSEANKKTKLELTIDKNSRPPEWATEYRLYLKQSKTNYDVIAPVTFHRDGTMAWIRIEGGDKNKVAEGDFLYVKSDTGGLNANSIRTKVLEVKDQDRNFLETLDNITGIETFQAAGTYFRVEVKDYSLNESAFSVFTGDTEYAFRSATTTNNWYTPATYVDDIQFKNDGLDDLTDNDTYTGSDDIRYEIEIDSVGATDTFRWREFNVSTDTLGAYTSSVAITGAAQALTNSLEITFGAITGHTLNDEWVIPTKSSVRGGDWNGGGSAGGDGRRAIMLFQSKSRSSDESIRAGAVITITYNDSASGSNVSSQSGLISENLTSSADYPNIEEWFYGDNIISSMSYPVDITSVMFRRGALQKADGQQLAIDKDGDNIYMAILSQSIYSGFAGSEIRIDTSISISEFDNNIIFETIPIDETTDIFYELSDTYAITGDVHIAPTPQVFGSVDAVIPINYFNSFGWYNGFESYKVGDTFNEKTMVLDTKPLVPIENYQSISRIASLTYSGTYESTTQYNALNEFNLSKVNFKDLDSSYGAIAKLYSADTDLMVFQHDKTHRVLFEKNITFDADGTGNISQSSEILGQEISFSGEYGICNDPESFAFFGNRIYHLDKDRGALMRLSVDGYTEISQNGMKDYFRTLPSIDKFVGGYDPYNDEYLINLTEDTAPLTLSFQEGIGFAAFYEYQPERIVGINNRMYSIKDGQIWLHDDNTTRNSFYGAQRSAYIETVFADYPQDIKHFKSVNLESDVIWDATITTNFGTSTITSAEWSLEETEYYAYIRQNESTLLDTGALSTYQGIGVITSVVTNVLSFGLSLPRNLSIGDMLYKYDSGGDTFASTTFVTDLDVIAGTITVNNSFGSIVGDYIAYGKDARVEGEAMKGYFMKIGLTSNSSTDNEMFAVKVEAVRSFD